jgi:hypothetical protein
MEVITGRDPVDYSRPNGEVSINTSSLGAKFDHNRKSLEE